ncbi:DUF4097 family beta strand repeat-containing protein [Sinobaca sp. H24]|uniref:DUF4097 family beta strand repeat-containing protein n=1 Tax=Sinobaca sp. H24 TaxID=2923376 RepID=UPI00207AF7EF|nr:DUF4097 family beta strand repeat-containing protein [Sinobaca sp. H24]
MSTGKKIIFVSFILIFIGIAGSIFSFNQLDSKAYSAEKTLDEPFINLSMDLNNDSIELLPTEDSVTRVEMQGLDSENPDDEVMMEVRDNTLFIESAESPQVFNIGLFSEEAKLTVYLPESTYESVVMKTDNGNLHASRLNVESMKADTNNGDVRLKDMTGSRTEVTADNGNVEMAEVQGDISGTLNNGDITLSTNAIEHPMDLETDNGNIEISTETKPANADFAIKTDNGTARLFGKDNSNEVFGEGEIPVTLRSNNGDITVDH